MPKYYVVIEGEYFAGTYWSPTEEGAKKLAEELSRYYKGCIIRVLPQQDYYRWREARFGSYEVRRRVKEYQKELERKQRELRKRIEELVKRYDELRKKSEKNFEYLKKLKENANKIEIKILNTHKELEKIREKEQTIYQKAEVIRRELEELRRIKEKIVSIGIGHPEFIVKNPRLQKIIEEEKSKIAELNKYIEELERIRNLKNAKIQELNKYLEEKSKIEKEYSNVVKQLEKIRDEFNKLLEEREKIEKEYANLIKDKEVFLEGIQRKLERIKKLQEEYYGNEIKGLFIPEFTQTIDKIDDIEEKKEINKIDKFIKESKEEIKSSTINLEELVEKKIKEVEAKIGGKIPPHLREKVKKALMEGKTVEIADVRITLPNPLKVQTYQAKKELYTVEDIPVIGKYISEGKEAISQFFDKTYLPPPLAPLLTPPKEFVKGFVESILFGPFETPVFIANLLTKPQKTIEATIEGAKQNPAYFVGSLIGGIIGPKAITKAMKIGEIKPIGERTLIEYTTGKKTIAFNKKPLTPIVEIRKSLAEATETTIKAVLDLENLKLEDIIGFSREKLLAVDVIKTTPEIKSIIHEKLYQKVPFGEKIGIRTVMEEGITKIQLIKKKGQKAEVKELRYRIFKDSEIFDKENKGILRILEGLKEDTKRIAKNVEKIIGRESKEKPSILKDRPRLDISVEPKELRTFYKIDLDIKKLLGISKKQKSQTTTINKLKPKVIWLNIQEPVSTGKQKYIENIKLNEAIKPITISLTPTFQPDKKKETIKVKTKPKEIINAKTKVKTILDSKPKEDLKIPSILETPLITEVQTKTTLTTPKTVTLTTPVINPISLNNISISRKQKIKTPKGIRRKSSTILDDILGSGIWSSEIKINPVADIWDILGVNKKR